MLFIPLEKAIDWKKPPVITIALILINTFIYFVFQSNDNENYHEGMKFYYTSGLAEIEIPFYKRYLQKIKQLDNKNTDKPAALITSEVSEEKSEEELHKLSKQEQKEYLIKKYALLKKMLSDGKFLALLDAGEIIRKDDNTYSEWVKLSGEFKEKIRTATFYEYGLQAYKPSVVTLITHMFLHADFSHLLGNMIFLFIFGFSIEMILGWRIFLFTYILAGVGSALFYIGLEPYNASSGIGASGAISGLTGMYTVLYGFRKIRFFYFAFVFFDTVKAPALIILPLWLGYELYNHYFIPSNINNLAHAGGLISGAIIAFLAKKYYRNIDANYMDENSKNEEFDLLFAQAMQYVSSLQADKAKILFLQLHNERPNDTEVLKQLFNITKFNPSSVDFHDSALKIFLLKERNSQINNLIFSTYKEYISIAKPAPKLNAEQLMVLVFRFLQDNHLDEAEQIIVFLLKKKIRHKSLINSLQTLADKYSVSNSKKSRYFLDMRNTLFPK